MNYLLDTCVALWVTENKTEKLKTFRHLFRDKDNVFFVSMASYWEIVMKSSSGKLKGQEYFFETIQENNARWLPIDLEHLEVLKTLPLIHRDPFDRLLIAQAKASHMKLLTLDETIMKYFQ